MSASNLEVVSLSHLHGSVPQLHHSATGECLLVCCPELGSRMHLQAGGDLKGGKAGGVAHRGKGGRIEGLPLPHALTVRTADM